MASRYAPQWYYLETEHEGCVRNFLKCRTFGLCMAHNRLLGFHVVRSTRPVVWTPTDFVPERSSRTPRPEYHLERYPQYPEPHFFLNHTGKYFFRNDALRGLRLEQYNRYWATVEEGSGGATLEDTCCEEGILPQAEHKDYDQFSESVPEGQRFASSMKHVEGLRRRHQSRLAVSRVATLEPLCASREKFYEQRLLLGLSWYCDAPPSTRLSGDGLVVVDWTFMWTPPTAAVLGARLDPQVLVLAPDRAVSFERVCAQIEKEFCRRKHKLICACCALESDEQKCRACRYCTGFHRCYNEHRDTGKLRWRKGSLHGGDLDIQRVMFNLHRKRLPLEVLNKKADDYVAEGLISSDKARNMMLVIEQERNCVRTVNEVSDDDETAAERKGISTRLSLTEMAAELHRREELMKAGSTDLTDQWRVYTHIVNSLRLGAPLRLMVQASAGTGKSFILTTTFLWCIVNGKKARACAPTGIAAANVEIEGTEVGAQTIHALLDLNTELESKLDFTKDNAKTAALMSLDVLFIDEVCG